MEKYKQITYYSLIIILFLLGIFLRTKLYIASNVFEDDECRLIITLLDKNFWQMFLSLGDAQSAPPLFLCASKLLGNISGYEEHVVKLIPFICGIASIFVFYKMCSEYFTKKIATLVSLFVFTLSTPLIQFSTIFKQYSTDVLISLLCLYYFPKLELQKLNIKQTALLGLVVIILPFISLPSLFFIFTLFIKNFTQAYKRILIILIPFSIIMSCYYFFNLFPSRINLEYFFPQYWDDGFWSLSIKDFIRFLLVNLKFYFVPNNYSLFQMILLFLGIFACAKDKSATKNVSLFILISTAVIFAAALLHIYPLCGRVGLYFISIMIILIIKPVEYFQNNKPMLFIISLFIILSFFKYPGNIKNLTNNSYFLNYSSKNLMLVLKEKYNPETDTIITNSASTASYLFYSSKYKLFTDNVFEMYTKPTTRESVLEYLNHLKKGQCFWFYLIKDYSKSPVFPYIDEWLKDKEILYYTKELKSVLIYIRN